MARGQRCEHRIDEARLAREYIDCRIGDLAVHLQHQPHLRHACEHRIEPARIGDSRVGVRSGARGVQLAAEHTARRLRTRDLLHRRVVGEIERHQRLELHAGGERRPDALAIGEGGCHRGDRRGEVRHDDGTCEACRGERQHRGESRTITQVQVPVIRPPDDEWAHRELSSDSVTFCFSNSSRASLTPKPVTSVGTWASPPVRVAEERSM